MKTISLIGYKVISLVSYVGCTTALLADTLSRIFTAGSPRRWKWVSSQMLQVGVRSLSVSGIILLVIGMVIAFQTAYQMRLVGAQMLIPGMVAVSITRELGPMMTALVVAGRAGAAMTAEIGTMKVTEQVDALEAMGVSPVEYLVVPRFLAITLMIPILTIYSDVIGILGGYIVCVGKLGITHTMFFNRVFDALVLSDVITGLAKSVIFGAIICVASCWEGLRVRGGAGGVGQSTMRAVVASFILIILADFLFTALFYILPI